MPVIEQSEFAVRRSWCAIASFAALAISTSGHPPSVDALELPTDARSAKSTPALFEVANGKGGRLRLLGTVHVGNSSLYPLAPTVASALATSRALVLEGPASPDDARRAYQAFAIYPAGTSLWQRLPPALTVRTVRTLDKLHMSKDDVEHLRPLAVATALETRDHAAAGYEIRLGTEQILASMARELGKPILGLEDPSESIRLEFQVPEIDQIAFLDRTIVDIDSGRNRMDLVRTVDTWRSGDLVGLASLLDEQLSRMPSGMQRHERATILQRNEAIAKRLEQFLQSGDDYFVAVGVLHLVGPQGILNRLNRSGYILNRL